MDAINVPSVNNKKDMPASTSNHRQKYISNEQLGCINQYLLANSLKVKRALETYLFLNETLFTGFRPSEWRTAEIAESSAMQPVAIRTINLKQVKPGDYAVESKKSRRYTSSLSSVATEYSRSISIEHLDEDQKDIIIQHFGNVQMLNDLEWKAFYKSVVYTLAKTQQNLFPDKQKTINLYSARHQFSANQKKHLAAAVFTERETEILVASLMGHASKQSQLFYAGKRRGDTSGNYALPVSEKTISFLKRLER